MINKIIFDAFKTDRINDFKKNGCSVNSIAANRYEGRLSFFVRSPNRRYPLDKISTEVYILDVNRSNHYGVRLPYQYVKANVHIMRWGYSLDCYRVVYTNVEICEATPFKFQNWSITFKPYSMKHCADLFAQFLQWDYHSVVSIRYVDTKYRLIALNIDADLEPITDYFTVNPYSTPNLEFTFKRINKIQQCENGDRLTCVYQLANVKTTTFDEVHSDENRKHKHIWEMTDEEKKEFINNYSGTCDFEWIIDPTKITVTVGNSTYEVLDSTKESIKDTTDPVNHPNHYEMVGPFESFDIIVESLGIEGARYFCQGNVIKYQTRYRQKNGEEDLKKRHWYSRMDQMLAKCKTIEDYYKLKESDF